MEKNESKIYEKMYGKKIMTEELNIEGFDKPIPFDIYDGYAVCEDYEGKRYDMKYPQLRAVRESEELSSAIIDYIGNINGVNEISVIHVLESFCTLYCDGVEVVPEAA